MLFVVFNVVCCIHSDDDISTHTMIWQKLWPNELHNKFNSGKSTNRFALLTRWCSNSYIVKAKAECKDKYNGTFPCQQLANILTQVTFPPHVTCNTHSIFQETILLL